MSSLEHILPFNYSSHENVFPSNNDWAVVNGPVDIVMEVISEPFPVNVIQENNIVPAKEWIVSRQGVCFKVSISNFYAEKYTGIFDFDVA